MHDYHLSRTTLFLPLFGRYENEVEHDTTTVIPPLLFYRHATPTDVTMVGFPLLWDFKRGESKTLEFKSTLRWNTKEDRKDDKVITHSALKTVAAFLNTDGGDLLIGVRDDGSIIGIERDPRAVAALDRPLV